jgi:hypothetical protein
MESAGMFCPKCAAHNIDDARYCRVCGADISLLPQLLSGQLTADLAIADEHAVEKRSRGRKRKDEDKDKDKPPTLEKAFENIGVGLAFLIISIIIAFYMPAGRLWWFWMLIPALACAGEGLGQLMRWQREKAVGGKREPLFPVSREADVRSLPPRDTSEIMMPPSSITERTTRHLSIEPAKNKPDEPAERPQHTMDADLK